jgi:predicted DNA-binding protein with PD1-like motif
VSDTTHSLTFDTRISRVIIGRVSRGETLRAALHRIVDEHDVRTAWVSAIGAFEWIDLTEYNQETRRYEKAHRFERCELLSMQGNLSLREEEPFWHLHATISLREDGKDVTYGGHVDDGVVFALELRIECLDELELRRADDPATGLQLWAGAEEHDAPAANAEPSAVEPPGAWAQVAAVSAVVEPEPDIPKPAKGDWIDHAKFGLCKIEGLSGDGVTIIKLPNATRKKIKLDALRVLPPRQDGPRRIYPVHRK